MLNRIEEDYNKFRKKEYLFILEDDNVISLRFKKTNLPHLIGIGKLQNDDETIKKFVEKKISAKDVLKHLKAEGKTYESLKNYESWTGHLTRRMTNFDYSNINLLIRQSVVIDYVFDFSVTNNDKAKFIFYVETNQIHLHLYIGRDEEKKYYFPNSFTAEGKKDHNSGSVRKIKVSKVVIQDGSVTEEINHSYYKNIIRELRPKIKSVNELLVTLNSAVRKSENPLNIHDYQRKLHEGRVELKEIFKIINEYIPIKDFLRIKNNNRILKYYEQLDQQYKV